MKFRMPYTSTRLESSSGKRLELQKSSRRKAGKTAISIYTVELMEIKEQLPEKDKSPTASVEGPESRPARPEDSSIIMLPVS